MGGTCRKKGVPWWEETKAIVVNSILKRKPRTMTAAGNQDPEAVRQKTSAAGGKFPGMAPCWVKGEYIPL